MTEEFNFKNLDKFEFLVKKALTNAMTNKKTTLTNARSPKC